MEFKKVPSSATDRDDEFSLDLKQIDKAKDIVMSLANTVSSMKLFPLDHATVRHFSDDLSAKILTFLDANQRLEVGIQEYALTYLGKPIYRDETSIKSLPFFFFKDGMQMLTFYQGLDKSEIVEFLELIKRESLKPSDESDIVNALWERDFSSIQYFAPEEFIENRILEERNESLSKTGLSVLPAEFAAQAVDLKIDRSKLGKGRLELAPDDKEDVRSWPRAGLDERFGPEEEEAAPPIRDADLSEGDLTAIDSLILKNRTISPEQEFLDLIAEIFYLEEGEEQRTSSLAVLTEFHEEQLLKGNFGASILLVRKIRELRDVFASRSPEISGQLEDFLKTIISEKTLEAIKTLFQQPVALDSSALFEFLKLLGTPAYPLAADLYEAVPSPELRGLAAAFFRDIKDFGVLAGLADESRPLLSKEIVHILGDSPDSKAHQQLAAFVSFKNRDIKAEAIQTLGRIKNDIAGKILLAFLSDPDEGLRIQAALKLDRLEDLGRLRHLIHEASSKEFRRKSFEERQAIFRFLGRTRSEDGFNFLKRTLEQGSFLSRSRTEMRLCAAAGLESMATPRARDILRSGVRFRSKPVREACLRAAESLSGLEQGA